MLSRFVDRTVAPIGVFSILVSATYALCNTLPPIIVAAAFGLATVYIGNALIYAFNTERKLDALGKRAPAYRRWIWTPFNVGMLLEAVYYFKQRRNHEWWMRMFANRPSHTGEAVVMNARIVFTAHEDNVKAILASQFADYGKGPQFRKEWKDFLGLSIFTTDGNMWHDSRMLLRPQFIKDRVSDLQTFEKHVQVLLPLLSENGNGVTVQADDLFYRFTLDAVTDFLLGKSVDSLHNGQTDFATAFSEVQSWQSMMARAGPLARHLPKPGFHRALGVMNKFVGTYIDRALALSPEELEKRTKSDEGYTFLHAIAAYTRDRQVLRDQLVAVLLAGRDTTAVTLSWLFYELSANPDILRKLRQEIESVVGMDQLPTYNHLKNMRYLNHTINETLRLYPVVPYNVRVALADTTLPVGGGPDGSEPIAVLEGTPIGYSTFVMQRRADIYPPESADFPHHLKFAPERWDKWTPKAWTYVPFNGGPRICIGQQFALTEMAYVITRILQTYDRIDCRMSAPPAFNAEIVLQPAPSVDVGFYRVGSSN